ncbi:MAG: hypothetical protein Q8P67_26615, partial [archaeon]|nr:hypothetical protein [archaeon]
RGAFQLIFTWGNRDQVTDGTGCLQFSAVRVRPGYSGAFWPSFHAAGMRVQSSDLLEVYNPQEPEQQIEENSEAGAFLLAALLIPLFFANSLWITNPVVITGSLLLGIVVLSWFLAIRCLVFVSLAQQTNLDGITLSWQIYVFLFLVATWVTVVRVALLYWLGKDEKYFYEFRRMRIYIRHVKKLLNPNHDAQGYDFEQEPGIKALLGIEQAWRWFRVKVMRCCPCCNCFLFRCGCCEHGSEATRPHWESHTEHPFVSFRPDSEIDRIDDQDDIDDVAHENVLPPDRQFRGSRAPHPNRLTAHTACGWRLRNLCCPIVRADAYMGEDDWVYSQRFISAMLMSALALVYCFLWSVWAVRRFESFMIQFQGWAVFLKVWTERVIQLLLGNSELASEVFNAYILTYVGLFFDFAASADQHLDYLFTWSGLTAAALSFVIICVVWMDIIGAYKSFIIKFRRGEMRKIFREHSFHVGNASRYVGVQTGHVLFGYFLLFFTLWITLIIFSSHWVRKLMLESFFALFIWLLGLHLALTIIRLTLTNFVLTHGFDLRYPRFYFFWDFINSFAEVLAGLATTLLRLGVALGGMIATFTRIHLPLLGWTTLEGFDAGYSSFISMVYADHLYNNPVLNVFVYLLVQQQRNWHLEQASSSATAEDQSDDEFSAAELKYSRFSRVVRSIKSTLGRLSSPSIPPPPTDPFQREIYLRRRRAVFRWQLAYCLLRNPSIRKYRRNLSKPLDFYHPRVNPLAPPISQPYQVIDSDADSPLPLSRPHEIRESAAHHSLDSIQVQMQW